jgi:polyisoprenoid-binding protein YceI
MLFRLRRLLITLLVAGGGLLLVGILVYSQVLDPGDKGDTSSDLVTPTLMVDSARVFEVSAEESQVDFVAEVGGVELSGVFPVAEGTITLEAVEDQLRVLVHLKIDVDNADTGNPGVTRIIRAAMETGDYPLAFYVATSRELVPVTEEEITFMLDGELQVHDVPNPHTMTVRAQLVGGDMWAIATSDLDLASHGVTFPAPLNNTTIHLTARLQCYEVVDGATPSPSPTVPQN